MSDNVGCTVAMLPTPHVRVTPATNCDTNPFLLDRLDQIKKVNIMWLYLCILYAYTEKQKTTELQTSVTLKHYLRHLNM